MLPGELWGALRLEPESVARRARFFSAYLGAAEQFPAPSPAGAGRRGGGSGLLAVGEPPGLTEGDLQLRESFERGAEQADWVFAAEEADSLREAAISMLMVDAERGRSWLGEAANRYQGLSAPYALFLGALANSSQDFEGSAASAGARLNSAARGEPAEDEEHLAPAQLVHLLLVFASSSSAAGEFGALSARLAEDPASDSGTAFGGSGAVVADWWRLGLSLLGLRSDRGRREELRERLSSLAERHGELLERAQMDHFHWRKLMSPVELVDLEVAGALSLANKRLQEDSEPFALEEFAELAPLARVSLTVGFEMGMGMDAGADALVPQPEPVN